MTVSIMDLYSAGKKCPFCCEEIAIGALKCRYCYSRLDRRGPRVTNSLLLLWGSGTVLIGLIGLFCRVGVDPKWATADVMLGFILVLQSINFYTQIP